MLFVKVCWSNIDKKWGTANIYRVLKSTRLSYRLSKLGYVQLVRLGKVSWVQLVLGTEIILERKKVRSYKLASLS